MGGLRYQKHDSVETHFPFENWFHAGFFSLAAEGKPLNVSFSFTTEKFFLLENFHISFYYYFQNGRLGGGGGGEEEKKVI